MDRIARGLDYDPWFHAYTLGLTIEVRSLPKGHRGEYWHDERLVFLKPGMTARETRSTLAHEIQHAIAGDMPLTVEQAEENAARELRTRYRTALQLISPPEFAAAEMLHAESHGSKLVNLSAELNVTRRIVSDWLTLVA